MSFLCSCKTRCFEVDNPTLPPQRNCRLREAFVEIPKKTEEIMKAKREKETREE